MYNKSGTSLKLKQKQSYSDHNLPFYHSIKKINKKIKKLTILSSYDKSQILLSLTLLIN